MAAEIAPLDTLKSVAGRCDVTTGVDVVFVHGAETDAVRCWHPPGHPEFSMPSMLARDLPYVCSWVLSYTSTVYRRKGHTLPFREQATQTIKELANRSLGRRPVVFVAHSAGGLLVKHVLRLARESQDPEWRAIIEQTVGVVFLSTPHLGFRFVRLARALTWLPTIGNAFLHDVTDLGALQELNRSFQDIVAERGMKVEVFYEGRPSRQLLWLARLVGETSADPRIPGVTPTVVNADHDGLSQPKGPDDHVYTSVRRFVRRCFAGPPRDVFISYAHEDAEAVAALRAQLAPLLEDGTHRMWSDQSISAAQAWETEIVRHMESSRLAVLLISKAFLRSAFIAQTELPFLRRKADTEGMALICVPLDAIDPGILAFNYALPEGGEQVFGLADVQWARPPEQPVASLPAAERDAFYAQLADTIAEKLGKHGG